MKKFSALLLGCLLLFAGMTIGGTAQTISSNWEVNGSVHVIYATNNTVYVGGGFTSIHPSTSATGRGAALNIATGKANTSFPFVNGVIWSAIPDGAGGVYIGGSFTEIGGIVRKGLARINANGSLHAWNPGQTSTIYAMVRHGDTLFVGGSFSSLGSQPRSYLGAISTTTGSVLAWNPLLNGQVFTLAATGNTLVVGGSFTTAGGVSRTRLVAYDMATCTMATWAPTANNDVRALYTVGSTLYAGGYFTNVSGSTRNYLALIDLATGNLLPQDYNLPMYGYASSFASKGDTLFIGGNFSAIGGQNRQRLAAVSTTTNSVLPWALTPSNIDGQVGVIAIVGDTLYAGGNFQTFNGAVHNFIASVDISTATATAWQPNLNNTVYTIAPISGGIYAGGMFTCVGHWLRRYRAAAFDATTGEPTNWDPSINNDVFAMASSGDTLYIGGTFGLAGGQARSNLVAVTATSGTLLSWSPNPNNVVYALAIADNTLYAGGLFTTVGGQPHNKLAALSLADGSVLPWNIDANNNVLALAAGNGTVYIGGDFTTVAGQARSRAAAIEATTGTVTAWDPNPANTVRKLSARDSTVYLGGDFFSIGGQAISRLAAVDATIGTLRSWNTNASSYVYNIATDYPTVYASGYFASIGGKPRAYIGAVDTNGAALAWRADADNAIEALAVAGNKICVGGSFTRIGNTQRNGFAMLSRALPAIQLGIASLTPSMPAGRQLITLTVEARTAEGDPMSVTQATTVGVSFSHPQLVLFSGTTQATIAADHQSATIILAIDNTGLTTAITTLTVSALNSSLSSTQQTLSILPPPAADRLVVSSISPALLLSDREITIAVETRNQDNVVMPVTQASTVSIAISHPQLVLISGSTQATIPAGHSSTSLTITVRNTGSTTASAGLTIADNSTKLMPTTATAAIEPPSSQLVVVDAPPYAKHRQPYTVVIGVKNPNNIVVPVTVATVVHTLFSHPSLVLISGSTQATIEAGTTRAVLNFAIANISGETVVTSCTFAAMDGSFASAQLSLSVEPAATHLAMSIAPSIPFSGQTFTVQISSLNKNGLAIPVTSATPVALSFVHPSLALAWGSTTGIISAGASSTTLSLTVYNTAASTIATIITASTPNFLTSTTAELAIAPAPTGFSFPATGTWIPNSTVQAITQSGNTVYLGGAFTSFVHPASVTGTLASFDTLTGQFAPGFPKVNGNIYAIAPDGEGGMIIGGSFSEVGGLPRNYIARINADGTVHAWNPSASNTVVALCATNGTVYAGGSFTTVGGQPRQRLAAISITSGTVLPWNPGANNSVTDIRALGSTLYIAGQFSIVNGSTRSYAAAIDVETAAVLPWNPAPSSSVEDLLILGDTIYACGSFGSIGGASRQYLAALDPTTGSALGWNPQPSTTVYALISDGTTLYAGGAFTTMSGQPRGGLAAFTVTTGTLTSLATGISNSGTIYSLLLRNNTLYSGGSFTVFGGQTRNRLAAINASTGALAEWNPNTNDIVRVMSPFGSRIAAGGGFTGAGTWVSRLYLAAVDATTGVLRDWAPSAGNIVYALAAYDTTIYAGGALTTVNNQPRLYAAALHATTGELLPWNPSANNQILSLVATDSAVYMGGYFTSIGGQTRNRAAAVDAATGSLRTWNPNASSTVFAIACAGDSIFIAGDFTTVGGQTRSRIAAVDTETGSLRTWNPSANSLVRTLYTANNTLYAGGDFSIIGGQSRSRLAMFDVATGALTPLNIAINGSVYTIVGDGAALYIGGSFSSVGGQSRSRIAAIDTSGTTLPWNPSASSYVYSLAAHNGTVHAGGIFRAIAGTTNEYYVALSGYVPAARVVVRSVSASTLKSQQSTAVTLDLQTATGQPAGAAQSTAIALLMDHPALSIASGSTQATIAAGSSSAIVTFALSNNGNTTCTVAVTALSTNALLTSTSFTLSVLPPAASQLRVVQVQPATAKSGETITLSVGAYNSNNLPMSVTEATVVGLTFAHPSLAVVSGSTQAVIAAGASTTTITVALHNNGNSAATTQFLISSQDASLLSTQQNITVQPPPSSRIAITSVVPASPGNALPFGVAIQARNSNNLPMAVTQATVVGIDFSHPSLTLSSGSTQATIAAGQSSTTLTLALSNSSTTAVSTVFSLSTLNATLVGTTQSITVQACVPVAVSITATGAIDMCAGSSVQLTATTSASYLWSNGEQTQSIAVSPSASAVYSVVVSNAIGCTGSTSISVVVHAPPVVEITANGATEFCKGSGVTLTASTGATYLWSDGSTTQSIAVAPISTTLYTVTIASIYGCMASTSLTVSVYNPLVASILAGSTTTICKGATAMLTASTGATYLWSNGSTMQSIAVAPMSTTLYTVTVGSVHGCTASSSAIITVYDLPAPALTGATTACLYTDGHVYQVQAVTGSTYTWFANGGNITSGQGTNNITVMWTAVSGTSVTVTRSTVEGCSSSTTLPVTVYPEPVVTITPTGAVEFCENSSVELDAGAGYTSYVWSNGATTQSIHVAASGSYSVVVSNSNGCTATSTSITITVYPLPIASVAASKTMPMCVYDIVELKAGTSASYHWSNGAVSQSIFVQPGQTTSYTVTVATAQGCTASTTFTVSVENTAAPIISGAVSVCPGTANNIYQTTVLPGYSYQWNVAGGAITSGQNTGSIEVTWGSQGSGLVQVQRSSPNSCVTTASASISISPGLVPVITSTSSTTFCKGGSVLLDAGAGYAWYAWSNGATTQTITVATSGSYSAMVGDAGGCSGTSASVSVVVHNIPTAQAGQDIAICASQSVQLQATGGVSYSWSPAVGLDNPLIATPIAQPASTTHYVVTVSNALGCESKDTVVVTVYPVKLDITAILEGAFNGVQMNTGIVSNGYLPQNQPFGNAPFYYSGQENITVVPGTVVDWVLLELRSAAGASSVIGRRAALLRNNGRIVDLDGVSTVAVPLTGVPDNNGFYVVVYHRNHLPVMSSQRINTDQSCTASHNFTTGQEQAYSIFAVPMKEVATGVYGMIAGDVQHDGVVNAPDRVAVRNATGTTGYVDTDLSLDSIVGAADRIAAQNNRFQLSQVP